MKYLADTSALVRLLRNQAADPWDELADRGLVTICEPAMAETLLLAETKKYEALETSIEEKYLKIDIPDGVWRLVAGIRRELASHSAHQGLSVADLVIAATALRLNMTILHEDADYETVARFVPKLRQQRLSTAVL